MTLIFIDPSHAVYMAPLYPGHFGAENWGNVNTFDNIIDDIRIGRKEAFEKTEIFISCRMVFKEGRAWEDTPFFSSALKRIEETGPRWKCRNREEFLQRLNKDINGLYRSISTLGFLRQDRIRAMAQDDAENQSELVSRFVRRSYPSRLQPQHEIKVGINEVGDILFLDGRHRFAIARLLRLKKVPARVVFRHRNMVRLRETLRNAATRHPEADESLEFAHPDLRDIRVPPPAALAQCADMAGKLGIPARILRHKKRPA